MQGAITLVYDVQRAICYDGNPCSRQKSILTHNLVQRKAPAPAGAWCFS